MGSGFQSPRELNRKLSLADISSGHWREEDSGDRPEASESGYRVATSSSWLGEGPLTLSLSSDLDDSVATYGSRRRRIRKLLSRGPARIKVAVSIAVFLSLATLGAWGAPLNAPYGLAVTEFRSGRFREASAALEDAVRQDPENASLQLLLARCYYELGDWDRAASYAESAENLEPQNAEAHLWLGQIYGRKAEEERSFRLAVRTRKEFEKAVSIDPSNLDARRDLMEFYLDAPWILGGGKGKAKRQVEAIAALDPVAGTLAQAHFDEKTGQVPEAEAEFRRVIDLKPSQVGPYLEVADFFESRQDVAGMATAVAAARKVNASDPRLSYYQGAIDVLQGARLDEAERDLKMYLTGVPHRSDYPSPASALSLLGQLYERLGKPQLAAQQYHAALQLDPHFSAALRGLDRLKEQ
jgi:tetratricopeptide (TPR) repeat protein